MENANARMIQLMAAFLLEYPIPRGEVMISTIMSEETNAAICLLLHR